ncbi:MAG: phosphoribosylanthranilate isomerase, partial [Halomonas sp.]
MSADPLTRTRIKFCGFTRSDDIDSAVAVGVDAVGFVMWPKSKRGVSVEQLAELSARVPAFVTRVGLFVDQSTELIEQCLPHLDLLQFHGDEMPEACQQYGVAWIKALRMRDEIDLAQQAERYHQAQALLLDAYRPGTPGGTGETFDWSRIPANLAKPVILAG